MARQRRLIKLKRNSGYRKLFYIEQANPHVRKLGVGPYQLVYKEKRIKLCPRHGECRDYLELIVRTHRELIQEMSKSKKEFCKKFNLPEFPERL